MPNGMFDDLIPSSKAAVNNGSGSSVVASPAPKYAKGMFDDLVPQPKPEAGYGEIVSKSVENSPIGVVGGLAGVGRGILESGDPMNFLAASIENKGSFLPALQFGASYLPTLAANAIFDKPAESLAMVQQEATRQIEENQPYIKPESNFKNIVASAAQSIPQQAPGILAAYLTKNPELALVPGMAQSAGQEYGEQVAAGQSPYQAGIPSAVAGVAERIGEKLPLSELLEQPAKAGVKGAAAKVVKVAAKDAVGESVTQAIQSANKKLTIEPNLTLDEALQRQIIAAGAGALGSGVTTSPIAAFEAYQASKGVQPPPEGQTTQNMGTDAQQQRIEPTFGEPPAPPPPPAGTADIPVALNRSDLADAINNDTPLPESKTISVSDLEIDENLRQQGFAVGAKIQQVDENGEILSGTLAAAQQNEGQLEVTIVDEQGQLRTLFSENGEISIATPAPQTVQPILTPEIISPDVAEVQQAVEPAMGQPIPAQPIAPEIAPQLGFEQTVTPVTSTVTPDVTSRNSKDQEYTAMPLEQLVQSLDNVKRMAKQNGWTKLTTTRARKLQEQLNARFPEYDAPKKIDIAQAAEQVDTAPTEAQKEAGNYRKGSVSVQGLPITLETPKGSERTGKDRDGEEWSVTMPAHYGYIKRTEGADGEQIDVYVGESPSSDKVFIVDQIDPETGDFDESKVMVGFNSQQEAAQTYNAAFSDGSGSQRSGAITEMPMSEFKTWLQKSNNKKPVAYKKPKPTPIDDVRTATLQPFIEFAKKLGKPSTESVNKFIQFVRDNRTIADNPAKEFFTEKYGTSGDIRMASRQFIADVYSGAYAGVKKQKPKKAEIEATRLSDFDIQKAESFAAEVLEKSKGKESQIADYFINAKEDMPQEIKNLENAATELLRNENLTAETRAKLESLRKPTQTPAPAQETARPQTVEQPQETAPVQAETAQPETIDYNGTKISQVRINQGENLPPKSMWSVQTMENKQREADGKPKSVLGDTLHNSLEEAKKAADFEKRQFEEKSQREQKQAEAKRVEEESKAAVKADTLNGFLDGKPAMQQGKMRVNLATQVRFNEGVMTKRERVESLWKAGKLETSTMQEPKIKPMTRSQFNRADAREQAAHEKRMKDAGDKTTYLVNGSDLGKVAYDYAQHLLKNSPQTAPKQDVTDTNVGDIVAPEPKKAAPVAEEKPADKIEDFGEKLHGAKKDMWTSYNHSLSDALPTNLTEITLSKHFPEPDYDALIEGGASVEVLAAIKAMRDEIPNKPRQPYKLARWAEQVKMFRQFSSDLLQDGSFYEKFKTKGEELRVLSPIFDKIKLYTELGYPAFTKAKGWKIRVSDISKKIDGEYQKFKSRWVASKDSYFGTDFDTREEAVEHIRKELSGEKSTAPRTVKLDIYRITKTGEIVIGKKVAAGKFVDLKDGFANPKDARAYLNDNYDDLVALLERKKDVPPVRRSTNDPRIGEDYREGENISPEKFSETFGFRGVQFGNYVEQKKRANDLNNAYDGLTDLANALGIPQQALSLDGQLGLAFGARGSGGKNPAAAHYEQGSVVINLTKYNGAGSLGHEWFHAFDNYFGKKRGFDYLTNNPFSTFESQAVRQEVNDAFKGISTAINKTNMKERSSKLDKTRSKDYWSTGHEMSARAFESYLIFKADQKGYKNDYLANIASQDSFEDAMGKDTYPYPTASEMETIAPAFDKLFEVVKTKQTDSGIAMYSLGNRSADSLQSSLLRAAQNLKQEKGTGAQFLAMLQKTAGIKEEEIAWTGLDDFLTNKRGVTKQEVVDYLEKNQVRLEDVTLGEDYGDVEAWWNDEGGANEETPFSDLSEKEKRDALERYRDEVGNYSESGTNTKFSQYTLPGGENYREVLITLPQRVKVTKQYQFNAVDKNGNKIEKIFDSREEAVKYAKEIGVEEYSTSGFEVKSTNKQHDFKSSHFDQPNILAHVRLNDRTINGQKTLFIEEIQSDWHQAGRKKGYKTGEKVPSTNFANWSRAKGIPDEIAQEIFDSKGKRGKMPDNTPAWNVWSEWNEFKLEEGQRATRESQGVPDAPFKKTWHEMALRRVVQMAANQGYDAVAWTTGETQNERYDLSKQIKMVAYNEKTGDFHAWSIDNESRSVKDADISEKNVTPEKLTDLIGKDVAEKIMSKKPQDTGGRVIEGVDLEIGGEGMKGFYDKILRNYAEKFGKKYDAKVGQANIGNPSAVTKIGTEWIVSGIDSDGVKISGRFGSEDMANQYLDRVKPIEIKVHSLPITDEMRDAASAGLEMFSRAGAELSPNSAQTKREIETAINQRLRELGFPSAKYQLFEDVKDTNLPSADAVDAEIEGAYYRGLIYISLNAPDPLSTLNHEAIHALKDAGAFTPAEWAALELNAAKWRKKYDIDANYGDLGLSESRLNEEAIAHAFQDHTVKGIVRRIINKTVRFIKALGEILSGKPFNFKTAEDVFDAVAKGKIGARIESETAIPVSGQLAFSRTAQINSPAFKNWFGKSKVVDSNGNPLPVFHGTTKVFEAFDTAKLGENTKAPSARQGFFFAGNAEVASSYAQIGDDAITIDDKPWFKVIDKITKGIAQKTYDKVMDTLGYEIIPETDTPNVVSVWLSIQNPFIIDYKGKSYREQTYNEVLIKAKKNGHDGVIIRNTFDPGRATQGQTQTDIFIAFEPNQIKSVNNEGTFNPQDDRIMYKLSKAPKAALEQAMENLAEQNSAAVEGLDRSLLRDIGGVAATILHPQQIATLNKEFTRVYLAVIERFKMREVLVHQLGKNITLYNKLKPKIRKGVDAALEIGRLSGQTFKADANGEIVVKNEGLKDTVHSKDGDVITLTPHQAEAYLGVRKTMDLALDKMIDTILEEYGLLEKGVKNIQDVEKLRLEAIKNKQLVEAAHYKDVLTRLYEVADAKKRGYVPFKRWGEIGVSVKNEDGELVRFERLELPKRLGKKDMIGENPVVADALERLSEQYGDSYQISFFEMNKFDEVAANIDIGQLDILAAGAGINEADYQRLREALLKEAQKKGFRAHFFRSKDIPGYSDDFERAINDYVVTASSYISRRLNERKIDQAVASVSSSGKPKLYEYAVRYQTYVNNPDEELAIIRSMAFYNYLAGNLSSGIINLTQPFIVTAPWFKAKFSHAQIAKQMSKASFDATSIMRPMTARSDLFNFEKAPLDVREALIKAQEEGDFLAMGTNDAMAIAGGGSQALRGFAKGRRAVGETIALTFSIPERFNRVVTFMAAYRFAIDPKNEAKIREFIKNDQLGRAMMDGKTGKDFAFAYAEFAVVSTQYRVGKMNRPEVMRSWGSLVFQFWSYLTQTLELMYKLKKVNGGKNNQALFMILLSIVALSGLKGFPFEDDLQSLFEALYKFRTGKDMDIDTIVREHLNKTANPFIAETIMKGLPASVLNVDISGRVGFGNVMPDQGTDFLGAWYNMLIERPLLAAEAANEERIYQAVSEIAPTFIGNAMKSFNWAEDGVRTQNNVKVIDANEVSTVDSSLKFLGFTSADISRKRDGVYAESRASQAVDELRSRFYNRLSKAHAERIRKYQEGDLERVEEMNELIAAINAEKDSHNASSTLQERIILNNYTLKQKVKQELQGAPARRIRKQARPRVLEIREIYGELD